MRLQDCPQTPQGACRGVGGNIAEALPCLQTFPGRRRIVVWRADAEGRGGVLRFGRLTGKEAHLWYAVAIDCETRQCPNVSHVDLTFTHPGSDGSHQACSQASMSMSVLKEAMREGWRYPRASHRITCEILSSSLT